MAQRTVVTVTCDREPDGEEVEAVDTFTFKSVDGVSYEVDVCKEHGAELREKFGDIVHGARRATSSAPRRRRGGFGRERSGEIRAWAKERGHQVSERGRIPAAIVAEYEASH